jgi:hypothetical protein
MAGGTAVIVIVVAADFVVSATEVPVNVTVAGFGTAAGAEYVIATPEALEAADSVPHVAPLQPEPDRVQVTPLFEGSFATVAVSDWVAPTWTLAAARDMVTAIAAGGVEPPLVPPPEPPLEPPFELTWAQPERKTPTIQVTTKEGRGVPLIWNRFTLHSLQVSLVCGDLYALPGGGAGYLLCQRHQHPAVP